MKKKLYVFFGLLLFLIMAVPCADFANAADNTALKKLKVGQTYQVRKTKLKQNQFYEFIPEQSGTYRVTVGNWNDLARDYEDEDLEIRIYQKVDKKETELISEVFRMGQYGISCNLEKGQNYYIEMELGQNYTLKIDLDPIQQTMASDSWEEVEAWYAQSCTLRAHVIPAEGLTYQWYYQDDVSKEDILIEGANASEYTIEEGAYLSSVHKYKCVTSYEDESFDSNYQVSAHSIDISSYAMEDTKYVNYGDLISYEYPVESTYGEVSYQWVLTDVMRGAVYEDSGSAGYAFDAYDNNIRCITCMISDGWETVTLIRNLKYNKLPKVVRSDYSGYVSNHNPVALSVKYTGDEGGSLADYEYAWYQIPYDYCLETFAGEPVLIEDADQPAIKVTPSEPYERYCCEAKGDGFPRKLFFDIHYCTLYVELDYQEYIAAPGDDLTIRLWTNEKTRWYHKAEGSQTYEFFAETEDEKLVLSNLTPSDSGYYKAYVKNAFPEEFYLDVKESDYVYDNEMRYPYHCSETGLYQVSDQNYKSYIKDVFDASGNSILSDSVNGVCFMTEGCDYEFLIQDGSLYSADWNVDHIQMDDDDCPGDDYDEEEFTYVTHSFLWDSDIHCDKLDADFTLSKEEMEGAKTFNITNSIKLAPGESCIYKYKAVETSVYCFASKASRLLIASVYDAAGNLLAGSTNGNDPWKTNFRLYQNLKKGNVYYIKLRNDTPYGNVSEGTVTLACRSIKDSLGSFSMKGIENQKDGAYLSWNRCKGADGYTVYISDNTDYRYSYVSYVYEYNYYNNYWLTDYMMGWKKVAEVPADQLSYYDKAAEKHPECVYLVRPRLKGFENTGRVVNWTFVKRPVLNSITNTEDGIRLKWDKVADVCGYVLYRSKNGGAYKEIATPGKNATSYTDKQSMTNGASYKYKLVSMKHYLESEKRYCDQICSAPSPVKTICRLSRPAISNVKRAGSGKIKVSWKKNSKASGYQIRYATSSSFKSAKSVKVAKNSTLSKTIGSLKKNKNYYVQVRSFKKKDGKTCYSKWSKYKKIKVK